MHTSLIRLESVLGPPEATHTELETTPLSWEYGVFFKIDLVAQIRHIIHGNLRRSDCERVDSLVRLGTPL